MQLGSRTFDVSYVVCRMCNQLIYVNAVDVTANSTLQRTFVSLHCTLESISVTINVCALAIVVVVVRREMN